MLYEVITPEISTAMAKKGKREKIKLESSAGTGHFYTTMKSYNFV